MRRLLVLTVLLALACTPAHAYQSGGGIGSGLAMAGTLDAGNQPTTGAAGSTVTVTWSQNAFLGAPLGGFAGGGYRVKRYPAAGGAASAPTGSCAGLVGGSGASLSCQDTGAGYGTWRYTVTPVLNSWTGAESPLSAAQSVALAAPVLAAITRTDPGASETTGTLQLSWNAVPGATGYDVFRRTGSGAYDFGAPLNGGTPLTATTFTDTGLSGSVAYSYVVRARAGALSSASSNEQGATPVARPAAPASVTATLAAAARIDVTWPAVTGATGYNVYRRTGAGAYVKLTPSPVTTTAYPDTATTGGTTYVYRVRAVGPGESGTLESFDSPESAAATADASTPTGALTDPGSPLRGTVPLTATASDTGSGVATVRFQRSPAGQSAWTTICTDPATPYTCAADTTAFGGDGLYDLRVQVTDGAGNQAASAVVASRRVDNTIPAVSLTDPGAYLRATVMLTATATDGGSGVASVRIQRAPTGTSTWIDVCTDAVTPFTCSLDTTTLAAGGYDLRAIALDVAGNTATSATVANRIVDNTAPTGTTGFSAANKTGGTAGRPEQGDIITYAFSESLRPASVMAGWAGAGTPVTVRFTNSGNSDVVTIFNGSTQIALGSITTGRSVVTANVDFTGTMTTSGSAVIVTLGTTTVAGGLLVQTSSSGSLSWAIPTATGVTDLAGNPLAAGTFTEPAPLDVDF